MGYGIWDIGYGEEIKMKMKMKREAEGCGLQAGQGPMGRSALPSVRLGGP